MRRDHDTPPAFNRAIISDILLWIALALLLGLGVCFWAVVLPDRKRETITLHFQDVNEITRGAMVRMMGTEVGYVDDIRLKGDHVDVVIKTYPGTLPIPSGSNFSILFTGLVGSKSIEIVPPEIPRPTQRGEKLFLVENPIRLKDMFNYQLDITQALQRGAENIADFFGKKKPVEELQYNIQATRRMVAKAQTSLDKSQAGISHFEADLADTIGNLLVSLEDFTDVTAHSAELTHPKKLDETVVRGLGYVKLAFLEQQAALAGFSAEHALGRYTTGSTRLSERIQTTHQQLQRHGFAQHLAQTHQRMERFDRFTDKLTGWQPDQALTSLRFAQQSLQGWSQNLEKWTAALQEQKQPPQQ